jgi:hypothetical protein
LPAAVAAVVVQLKELQQVAAEMAAKQAAAVLLELQTQVVVAAALVQPLETQLVVMAHRVL